MKWTVENVPELKGYAVESAEPDDFYLSRRNKLFHSKNLKPPFKQIAQIDAPFWKNAGAMVLTTGENGTISVSTDGNDLQLTTFNKEKILR